MKRSFPPARERLFGLAAIAIVGLACEPDNSVKPGAPELTQFVITQADGAFITITAETPDCATGTVGGESCDPMADTLCRQLAEKNFCNCVTDMADPPVSTWDCPPLANVTTVIAIFDRLLDTEPLMNPDPSMPGAEVGLVDFADVSAGAGAPAFETITDYSSSGTPMGLVTVLGGLFFGNHRLAGPSLVTAANPAFPSGTSVTVRLDGAKVRAKDGRTPFTGSGLLQDGEVSFTTAAFAASITVPDPTMLAMMPDVTIAFTAAVPDTIVDHVHVTSNGAPFTAVDIVPHGTTVTVTPTTAWPAGATIVVSVDATAENVLHQTISSAASEMFMTAAM
jgi:hypothetical protein